MMMDKMRIDRLPIDMLFDCVRTASHITFCSPAAVPADAVGLGVSDALVAVGMTLELLREYEQIHIMQ